MIGLPDITIPDPKLESGRHRPASSFGFNNPILVDEGLVILTGHSRAEAAKLLGLTEVPTVCLTWKEQPKRSDSNKILW